MKTGFFALAAFVSVILPPFAVLQSLPRSQATKAPAVQSAEAMRAALQPWLRAVAGLLSKTKDPELQVYLRVLRNAALMVPASEVDPMPLPSGCLAPRPTQPAHGSV